MSAANIAYRAVAPPLRRLIVPERWRASRLPSVPYRLPSVPSALRGLDPRHPLRRIRQLSERRRGAFVRASPGSNRTA